MSPESTITSNSMSLAVLQQKDVLILLYFEETQQNLQNIDVVIPGRHPNPQQGCKHSINTNTYAKMKYTLNNTMSLRCICSRDDNIAQ